MIDNTSGVSAPGAHYLVAWGGDKRSQDALKLGEILARTFDAVLDIVYVVQHSAHSLTLAASDMSYEQEIGKEAQGWLKKAAKSVGKGLQVEMHVAHDTSITQGIISTAQRLGSDAIFIGAGSGAGQPVATNAIVGGLLHASPVPVAMAPRNYLKVKFDSLTMLSAAVGPRPGAHKVVLEAAEAVSRVGMPLQLISLVSLETDKRLHIDGFDEAERVLEDAKRRVRDSAEVTTVIGKGPFAQGRRQEAELGRAHRAARRLVASGARAHHVPRLLGHPHALRATGADDRRAAPQQLLSGSRTARGRNPSRVPTSRRTGWGVHPPAEGS